MVDVLNQYDELKEIFMSIILVNDWTILIFTYILVDSFHCVCVFRELRVIYRIIYNSVHLDSQESTVLS